MTSRRARLLLIGNPTSLAGTFYKAFHQRRTQYKTIHISAFDTPNLLPDLPLLREALLVNTARKYFVELFNGRGVAQGSVRTQCSIRDQVNLNTDLTLIFMQPIRSLEPTIL